MRFNLNRAGSALLLTLSLSLLLPATGAPRNRTPSLDPIATQALITALAGPVGEYAARAEYAAVLAKFGAGIQPYANLLDAENRHVAALQQQCQKYGVAVPPDEAWGTVSAPATLLEAAEAGVLTETLNAAMYDGLLTQVTAYPSLVQVFSTLRDASRDQHLPALTAAVANDGQLPSVIQRNPRVRR